MWKAFFLQLREAGWQKLGLRRRLAVLTRCIASVFLRGASIMPFSNTLRKEVDVLQRVIVANVTRLPKRETEHITSYLRRRARNSRETCTQLGWWSKAWAERTISWDEHIQRDFHRQQLYYVDGCRSPLLPTSWSWTSQLRFFHDGKWLKDRRQTVTRSAIHGTTTTRTDTRAVRGRVHIRWEDGVVAARQS